MCAWFGNAMPRITASTNTMAMATIISSRRVIPWISRYQPRMVLALMGRAKGCCGAGARRTGHPHRGARRDACAAGRRDAAAPPRVPSDACIEASDDAQFERLQDRAGAIAHAQLG